MEKDKIELRNKLRKAFYKEVSRCYGRDSEMLATELAFGKTKIRKLIDEGAYDEYLLKDPDSWLK